MAEKSAAENSDQALDQLKAKLHRGVQEAEHGELLDGDDVFEQLRQAVESTRPKPIHQ